MEGQLAIQDLCAALDRGAVSRPDFADRCGALIAARVGCDDTAIWLLVDTESGRMAQPIGRAAMNSRWGLDLRSPCDAFSASLKSQGSIIAQDARAHAATTRFFSPELPASHVRSMLAVPFSINGDLFGAYVCVQFDRMIRWSAPQVSALRRVGASISPPLARATSFTMSARPPDPPAPRWAVRRSERCIDMP